MSCRGVIAAFLIQALRCFVCEHGEGRRISGHVEFLFVNSRPRRVVVDGWTSTPVYLRAIHVVPKRF